MSLFQFKGLTLGPSDPSVLRSLAAVDAWGVCCATYSGSRGVVGRTYLVPSSCGAKDGVSEAARAKLYTELP